MQHLMSGGSSGHALSMYLPPYCLQFAVATQIPATPLSPVQPPLTARGNLMVLAEVIKGVREVRRAVIRMVLVRGAMADV